MALGSELAAFTAGLDSLYRRTPRGDGFLDQEGLVPVAVAEIAPMELRSYQEAEDRLAVLRQRVLDEAETALRRDYLFEMVDSLFALLATFADKPISYAERVRRQIRVDTQKIGEATLDGYRATIRACLDELGYAGGGLDEDVRRWEADVRVPREAVLSSLRAFTEEARRRSSAMMYEMSAEWLEPVGIEQVPFSAYCDYPARQLLLNLDYPYTPFALKHLATHEAFPGHLVHLALRQRYTEAGIMPLDAAQVVTSSASSALFEGIADNALHFIDWLETPGDALGLALQRLRGALRCNAAWMMHAEGRATEELVGIVAEAGYMDTETVRSRLSFLSHPLRAPFIYAYWCGDRAVHEVWSTVPRERRAEFWAYLYGNMHTPTTLRRYWR